MATKVNDSLKIRETHSDLEDYNDELGQSNKDHYDDIEYEALTESINRGLTSINELNGRQLALINRDFEGWRTIIA